MEPLLLDLYCGAGGAGKGYSDAGFIVVGVDIAAQDNYPFEFHQADAIATLEYLLKRNGRYSLADFAAIHASPPCGAHTKSRMIHDREHADLLTPTRALLEQSGLPYVIENVPGAPMRPDLVLCGTMFDLPVRRHRYFEANFPLPPPRRCDHDDADHSFDHGRKQPESAYRDSMGCQWMTVLEARVAIPPAYTEYIGAALMQAVVERGGGAEAIASHVEDRIAA